MQKSITHSTFSTPLGFCCLPLPRLRPCVRLLSISRSVCLSAEMSPSFVTRLCSDWMVHPFSIWLTRLSRWRAHSYPRFSNLHRAVTQACVPNTDAKARDIFPVCMSARRLMYARTKKNVDWTHTITVCTHVNLRANTRCSVTTSYCAYKHASSLFLLIILV